MSESEEKKRVVILEPQRMGEARFLRLDWVLTAEEGTTVEDILDPQYWAHIATKLTPLDRVEARIDTGEWLLELLVLQKGANWAKVKVLAKHDLDCSEQPANTEGTCEVKWAGAHKFRVVRKADAAIISSKHETRDDAMRAMAQYERTLATT